MPIEEGSLGSFVRVVVIFAALAAVTGGRGSSAQSGAPGHNAAPPSTHHGAAALRPAAPRLELKSNAALVIDESLGLTLYAKNSELIVPIASITKLMTAMVVIDAQLPFEQEISIEVADTIGVRYTPSRLKVGSRLTRGDSLWLALMASENRGAAAAARTYPGGTRECVADMNRKAVALGMLHTRFADATGLSPDNVSTAHDLSKLVRAAYSYPQIRLFTTSPAHVVLLNGQALEFHNSNGLVKNPAWTIGLSKTGYINEAGRCLVMRAQIAARPVTIVLLDSWGKYTRLGDANRIRKWMESVLPASGRAL